jgi:hypothetical protein
MENTSFVYTRDPPQENPKGHHEEILVAESQPIDTQSLDSTLESSPEPETPKDEEPLPLEFSHIFEEDLFEDFGNTSNYSCQKKPLVPVTPLEPCEKEFLRETKMETSRREDRRGGLDWLGRPTDIAIQSGEDMAAAGGGARCCASSWRWDVARATGRQGRLQGCWSRRLALFHWRWISHTYSLAQQQ